METREILVESFKHHFKDTDVYVPHGNIIRGLLNCIGCNGYADEIRISKSTSLFPGNEIVYPAIIMKINFDGYNDAKMTLCIATTDDLDTITVVKIKSKIVEVHGPQSPLSAQIYDGTVKIMKHHELDDDIKKFFDYVKKEVEKAKEGK